MCYLGQSVSLQWETETQSCCDFYITTSTKLSAEEQQEILAPASCYKDIEYFY